MLARLAADLAFTRALTHQGAGAVAPAQPDSTSEFWNSLWRMPAPNPVRAFAWRLAHGVIPCNAMRAAERQRPVAESYCPCCRGPGCQRSRETYTHLFLECPAFAGAVGWLADVWEAVGGARPPTTADVIISDRLSTWPQAPPPGKQRQLWRALRSTLLFHIWAARCSADSTRHSAHAAVAATVAAVREDVQLQFNRTYCALSLQRHLPTCVLAMRRLRAACHHFDAYNEPALVTVGPMPAAPPQPPGLPAAPALPPLLVIRLSLAHPVPAPPPPAPLALPAPPMPGPDASPAPEPAPPAAPPA